MKKSLFVLLALTTLFCISCQNDVEVGNGEQLAFSTIGEKHNAILENYYNLNSTTRNCTYNNFNNYFNIDDKSVFIYLDVSRSIENGSLVSELDSKGYLENSAKNYIYAVEEILNNPNSSLESTQLAIVDIEEKASKELNDSDLIQFYSYSSTAKASLSFWNENIEILSDDSEEITRGIVSWWNKYKHKIAMSAASDAAGAAAGALVGATLGSSIPGIGSATGAIIGATIAGAASSIEGFKTGKLCIVIPYSKIENEM
ncbi:MAG: hypothetical protein E7062_03730 [Spirochaetaceae bacterium]|nr:hypothetical protein [Spirochaetaceae bacterium]